MIRLDGYGVLWVEEFKEGRFGLAAQDDRSRNDWGSALQKRFHLDPRATETVETAVAEALIFLGVRA